MHWKKNIIYPSIESFFSADTTCFDSHRIRYYLAKVLTHILYESKTILAGIYDEKLKLNQFFFIKNHFVANKPEFSPNCSQWHKRTIEIVQINHHTERVLKC